MQNIGLNQVKDRILILSPIVQGRLESELKTSDFQVLDRLGKGAFGKVYKTKLQKTGQIFALKQMEKQQILKQGMVKQIQTEVKVMYSLDHPNIIKLYNHFEEDAYIYLMIEYASGGQLWQKLTKEGRFDENTVKRYMADIILAVEYLHSQNPPIIHRDIKPENLILDENGRVKLVDFGWSNFKNRLRMTYCGTLDYLAPEMILELGHDEKLDIWSLGVLIFELITGKAPFAPKVENANIDQNQARQILEDNILKVKLDYPNDFPQLAKDLVNNLCKKEPNQRKTLPEIKKHPWFIIESEGKNIFEMEPWNYRPLASQKYKYCLTPNQINPLKLEGGFTPQFIADFATRLHQPLVMNILQQIAQKSQQNGNANPQLTQSGQSQNMNASQTSQQNQSNYEEEILNLKKKIASREQEKQDLESQKKELIVKLEVKERENTKLKDELDKYKSIGQDSTPTEQRRQILQNEEIEQLKKEKEELYEKQNEYENQIKQLQSDLKKIQDSRKDYEKYKIEKQQLNEKIKKFQESREQDNSDYLEKLQSKEQELSILQFKLNQYEKSKSVGVSGVNGGIIELIREMKSVIEEFKSKFAQTKKNIEIVEKYSTMERELMKLKLEKDTLQSELKAQIQEDYEDQIEQLKLSHKQEVTSLKDEYEKKVSDFQKKVELLQEEQSKKSQKVQENESLKKQIELANSTIQDLRKEQELSKEVRKNLERRLKDCEIEIQDYQQMLRNYKNNSIKK
ncbi:plant dual-specificity MAP kinase kinase family domain protein (macronuclear) [Tetrahymena thermophila SB210]|uniref:Aurora kinase n=1 Tax=Tetrahymena thermophila (strain SB210) TaxID=312017 RepID=I7M864_TETTS|nr:plant dual-specificity MAP kinase kinase family domain protein [Tetrahymena thermophila SB210]EAR97251.2 plant dual-specificity MAP kinase kinase family domain protein [Tetrahymena thermophila SB210]|eukprot:XP_001017496.2 plant dual-specificity MAP kinase kinase family domain protein [Tetrahymena thermophila SB210]